MARIKILPLSYGAVLPKCNTVPSSGGRGQAEMWEKHVLAEPSYILKRAKMK